MQKTISLRVPRISLSNSSTKDPCVILCAQESVQPLFVTNRMSYRILDTISREMRAYQMHVSEIETPFNISRSMPLSCWYHQILSQVYIPKYSDITTHNLNKSSSPSFALPVSSIKRDLENDAVCVFFKPPELWSISKSNDTNILRNEYEESAHHLLWIIPRTHQFYFGALVSNKNKEGFQRLLSPKAFQE